jgi:hypothetical protein
MSVYNRVLGEASRADRGRPRGGTERIFDKIRSGYVIRTMVGSHVRNRLSELAAAYAQLAATFPPGDPSRQWLDGAREDSERIADSLPRIRFRPLALLPAVAPLVVLLSQLPGWVGYLFLGVGIGLVAPLILGYVTVWKSYRFKRELLLPGASEIDKLDMEEQTEAVTDNVYAAEDFAFIAAWRGKRLEVQVDHGMRIVGLLVVTEAAIFAPAFLWKDGPGWVTAAVLVVALVLGFVLERKARHRYWR